MRILREAVEIGLMKPRDQAVGIFRASADFVEGDETVERIEIGVLDRLGHDRTGVLLECKNPVEETVPEIGRGISCGIISDQ
jgi:hypothetical protein